MALLPNVSIGAWPNLTAAPTTVLSAGDEDATMKAGNLADPDPSTPARLTSVFPHLSWWVAELNKATALRTVGLVRHSLQPGDAVRAVGVASGALPAVRSETLAPDAIVAETNRFSIALSAVQEHPSAHNGSAHIPAEFGDPWMVRYSFPTPASAPAAGGGDRGYQAFVLWVLESGVQGLPPDNPTVRARLFEDGVERADLGTKVVHGPGAFIFGWDAADLETADGSAVELQLDMTPGGVAYYASIDSVAWEVLYESAVTGLALDTAWQEIAGAAQEPEWGDTALEQTELPPPLWSVLRDPAVTVDKVRIELRGDGIGYFTDYQQTPTREPATFIDAGVLLLGPLWQSPYRFSPGGKLRYDWKLVGGGDALSGANHSQVQWRRRQCEVELAALPALTAQRVFERLDRGGPGNPFLLVLEPTADDPPTARNTTMYAQVTGAGGMVFGADFQVDGQRCRGLSYEFAEFL